MDILDYTLANIDEELPLKRHEAVSCYIALDSCRVELQAVEAGNPYVVSDSLELAYEALDILRRLLLGDDGGVVSIEDMYSTDDEGSKVYLCPGEAPLDFNSDECAAYEGLSPYYTEGDDALAAIVERLDKEQADGG